jgi:arginine:ornithine antiporter/lysine permease
VLYVWARREQGKTVFSKTSDWIVFGLIVAGAIYGIYGLATGSITI